MEKENLHVIKLTDTNYIRVLESALQFGHPVLLENVGEDLDPILEPILTKAVFKEGSMEVLKRRLISINERYVRLKVYIFVFCFEILQMIKVGDNVVPYSQDFRFYITTRLQNPHYLPEISVKVWFVFSFFILIYIFKIKLISCTDESYFFNLIYV